MNSIFKNLIAMMLVMLPTSFCFGQEIEKEDIQEVVESVEEIADEIEEQVEEIGEAIEEWMEENSEEIEEWVEQHGGDWGEWAEEFEKKMNRWAKGQERVWERWADSYSGRWEKWSKTLESNQIDSFELEKIIEGNLEMLSDIPLGQLIDGALKEGLSHLEDAPWESIDGLQGMIRRSIDQSVELVEDELDGVGQRLDRLDRAAREMAKAKAKRRVGRDGDIDEGIEFILPVDEGQPDSMDSKREAMDLQSAEKMKELQQLLKNKDADWKDAEAIIQEMRKIKKAKANLQKKNGTSQDRERARKEAIGNARRLAEARLNQRSNNVRSGAAKDGKQDPEKSNAKAKVREKRLERLLKRFEETQAENESSRESLKKIYQQLIKEEKKINSKDAMIEDLKEQIKVLSREIKDLKKGK